MKVWRWRRRVALSAKEKWEKELDWLGVGRVVWIETPHRKSLLLEAYPATTRAACHLMGTCGGRLECLRPSDWLSAAAPPASRRIGRELLIVHTPEQRREARRRMTCRHMLFVPAELAFGTGEHPTTAMMVRQVMGWKGLADGRFLDLGTGSGILALAARRAGAGAVTGVDIDPLAIRTARRNEGVNFHRPLIRWIRADVLRWKSPGRFQLVTANLFRDILVEAAPRIWNSVAPEGGLILSGLLRPQTRGIIRVYARLGAKRPGILKKGKWSCVIYRKVG